MRGLSCWKAACALVAITASAADYGDPHWGVQGDIGFGVIPETFNIPLQPEITALTWNAGLVHFHATGAPSYSIEYTRLRAAFDTTDYVLPTNPSLHVPATVTGSGTLRGVMITKFVNFFVREHVSAGLAFGGGYNKLEAGYDEFLYGVLIQRKRYNYDVPAVQVLAQSDIRPIRWLSLGPYFGLRDGFITGGGALRIHFRR